MHVALSPGWGASPTRSATLHEERAGNGCTQLVVRFASGIVGWRGDHNRLRAANRTNQSKRQRDAIQGDESIVGGYQHGSQTQPIEAVDATSNLDGHGSPRIQQTRRRDNIEDSACSKEQIGKRGGISGLSESLEFGARWCSKIEKIHSVMVGRHQNRRKPLASGQIGNRDFVHTTALSRNVLCAEQERNYCHCDCGETCVSCRLGG